MAARSLISRLGRSDARLRRPTEVATFAAGCFWGVEADFPRARRCHRPERRVHRRPGPESERRSALAAPATRRPSG
jgi:hypothetical protein